MDDAGAEDDVFGWADSTTGAAVALTTSVVEKVMDFDFEGASVAVTTGAAVALG
ncbi:hypothetical protein D3C71_1734610 [compost metagenome]